MSDQKVREHEVSYTVDLFDMPDPQVAAETARKAVLSTESVWFVRETYTETVTPVTLPQPDVDTALRQLIADGLTFGAAMHIFAEANDDEAERYIAVAREKYEVEGEVEFDDATITSGSDDAGDYVLAWIWVSDQDVEASDG